MTGWLVARDGDPEEGRGDARGVFLRALVLAREQSFQLTLKIAGAAVLFRRLERIHARPIILPEGIDERRRRPGEVEVVGVPGKRDVLLRDASGPEALAHVALDAPGHRADEA